MEWLQQHRWQVLWGVVLALGIAARLWSFPYTPVSLYWDEMAIVNDALSVAATGRDMHGKGALQAIFISYGDYKSPVYIWFAAIVALFTKNWFLIARVPSVLAGMSMLIGVPWGVAGWMQLERSTRNWRQSLPWCVVAILAVLPWSLHFSRVGFEGHLGATLVVWSLGAWIWSLVAGREENFRRQSLLAGLAVGLGTAAVYTYFSIRFVWPVAALTAITVWWPRLKWRDLAVYSVAVVIWIIALIPLFQADFYDASTRLRLSTENILNDAERPHQINQWRLWSGNGLVARVLYNEPLWIVRAGVENLAAHLDPVYLFVRGQDQLRHGTGTTGVMFWWMAPLFFLGVLGSWRISWRFGVWLLVWFGVALVPAAVPTDVPHALRSLNALPVLAIWTGLGLWLVYQESLKWSVWVQRGVFATVAFTALLSVMSYQLTWSTSYAQASAESWQDGYIELGQFVQAQRETYPNIVIDNFDERFFLYYQPISGYTWTELQSMPTDAFQRQLFGSVEVIDLNKAGRREIEAGTLLIVTPDNIPVGFTQVGTIYGATGEERFVAVVR